MTRETAARIEQEATQWLMRLDRDGRTPALEAELNAWLAGDSRRRGAWLQAEAAWALLDGLAGEDRFDHVPVPAGPAPAPPLSRRLLLAGGASALAASLVGGFLFLAGGESYTTGLGEIRRVPLADGSTAAINTQSRIAVAFATRRRTVWLAEGEAFFQVARDPSRPFVVEAGRVRVQAVGTAFSVRRRGNGAEVLVTEGIVEAWAEGAEGARIRLTAGQRAFVADDAAISRPATEPSEVDRALAWRSGRIDLAGETLGHAAEEFNRYNRRQIAIADSSLAGERFFGVFRTDDPEGFALAVHSSLGVPVQAGADTIRIGRPVP
jgi:transmembrane sensor